MREGCLVIYFDEAKNYQYLLDYLRTDDNKYRDLIMLEAALIVDSIIYTHKFTAYAPKDDLHQIGLEAVLCSLKRFNVNYVCKSGLHTTLFNYISLVVKRALTFSTLHEHKHRAVAPVDVLEDILVAPNDRPDTEKCIEDFISTYEKCKINYKYPELQMLFIKFLREYKMFSSVSFRRYCMKYGWAKTKTKSFLQNLKNIRKYYNEE